MASLPPIFSFTPSRTRVYATAAKGTGGGSKEEKGLWDFVLGALTKQEQFYETDPLFNKDEDETTGGTGTTGSTGKRSGTTGSIGRKNSVSIPQKKKDNGGFGGLGGLFAKK